MTTEELLRELESQTHSQRVRAMVELGRQDTAENKAIIAELERGDFYSRSLALYACYGSRDAAHVLRALHDPSRLMRGPAIRLVALVCDDAETMRALDETPPNMRARLIRNLRERKGFDIADAWLAAQTPATPRFVSLIPLASSNLAPQLLANHATLFTERATQTDWNNLARRHPAQASALLREQIATTTEPDGRLLWRLNAALPALANSDPDAALALVSEMGRLSQLRHIHYDRLAVRRPAQLANLILFEPESFAIRSISFRLRIRSLSTEQIIALYRRDHSVFGWGKGWFRHIAPEQRATVFEGLGELLKTHSDILRSLPTVEREREARKALADTTQKIEQRLYYASMLGWDEARATLDPYLRASEAATRLAALKALIRAVVYNRSHLDDALDEVERRRNEQDSVRQAMLSALRELPPTVWRVEHLPILAEIIRSGLNDVSLSDMSRIEIMQLLLKLMPMFPDWASEQFVQTMRERGARWLRGIPQLPLLAELRLAQALTSVLDLWATRLDDESSLDILDKLFTKPAAFALAIPAVTTFLTRTHNRPNAARALTLLRERAPTEFARFVSEALAADPSWITFSVVSDFLFRNRQDLLGPFLVWQPYDGRWGTDQKPFLPPLTGLLAGATATQQQRYADATMAIASDETQPSSDTINAIKWLALLPAISAERLATLADDKRSVARTSALLALARMDQPAGGLHTLLAALEDDRARIAIHSLRRYLLAMPAQAALEILRGVALDRVTVAKEVIRLIGDLPPDVGYPELLAFARRDLHRDVRIALLRTLDRYLDRAQSWELLEEATRSSERELALAPLSLSSLDDAESLATTQSVATQRHVLRLLAPLVTHPDAEAQREAVRYCAMLGIADEEQTLTPTLVARVEEAVTAAQTRTDFDVGAAIAAAFFGVCRANDTEGMARVMRALLPHRRPLERAVGSLTAAPRTLERRLMPVLRAAIAALATDPLTTRLRVDIAIARFLADALETFLRDLATADALDAETLISTASKLASVRNRSDNAAFFALEARLGASDDERLRRLALAILQSRASNMGGWDDALLERLRIYRADPSPLVAAAAQFTFPAKADE